MSEHLSPIQIEGYRRYKLAPEELLGVDAHLADCEECRQRVDDALSHGAGETTVYAQLSSETGVGDHLSFEQSADYVEKSLSGDALQTVSDHLASCAECAIVVDEFRALRNQLAPEFDRERRPASTTAPTTPAVSRSGWRESIAMLRSSFFAKPSVPIIGAALVILLLAAGGWMTWRALQKRDSQPPIATTSPTPSPAISPAVNKPEPELLVQLNDGGAIVGLDREGRLSGVDSMPPEYQRLVKEAMTSQRIRKSPLLAGLSRAKGTLMGADEQGNQFSLTEPVGVIVLTDRPRVHWSGLQGATEYIVQIYDAKFNPVATSPALRQTNWTAPPLARGNVYQWQVKAFKNGETFTAPSLSASPAKFRVIDRAAAEQLDEARRAYPSSHLLLGLLYAQAGLLKEADAEFRALQQSNPDSEAARKLSTSLSSLRN